MTGTEKVELTYKKLLRLFPLLIALLALAVPGQAHATTVASHFNGVIAPASWGLPEINPFPGPGPTPGPTPPPFPPPPLLVLVIPVMGHFSSNQKLSPDVSGVFVILTVIMNSPFGQPSLIFNGTSMSASFQVNGPLTTASLNATVHGFDLVSHSPKTITVTVSWTGTGDLTHASSATRFQENGFSLITHFTGSFRMATATGSLSGDVTATLGQSTSAILARAEDGTVLKTP